MEAINIILKKGEINNTYNIGARFEISNIEIAFLILKIMDEDYPIALNKNNNKNYESYKQLICFVEDRKGHDRRYGIDPSKIESDLKWFPKESFDTGIRKTIKFYYENYDL